MQKLLEHIRNKPVEHRARIIWICAGIVVALLLIVWIFTGIGYNKDKTGTFFQTFNQGVEDGKNKYENPLKK